MTFFQQGNTSGIRPSPIALHRNEIRTLLKKGSKGNACAFTQAITFYLDFLSEYFFLLGYRDPEARLRQIRATLIECYRYAPYIRRVSDFERFLEIQLGKNESQTSLDLPEPHDRLARLNHIQRFLLVARVYQYWSYRSVRLSTRMRKPQISTALSDLKCELIGFKPQMLSVRQQSLIIRVSELLEDELKPREARALENEIVGDYHVLQFKAEWLSYRCELAELKQQMNISPERVAHFRNAFRDALKDLPIERPNFRDNLINQISFVRIPTS